MTMTVGELVERLLTQPQEAPVRIIVDNRSSAVFDVWLHRGVVKICDE